MLCLKCSGVCFLFSKGNKQFVLCCNECNHEESVVCPTDELGSRAFSLQDSDDRANYGHPLGANPFPVSHS